MIKAALRLWYFDRHPMPSITQHTSQIPDPLHIIRLYVVGGVCCLTDNLNITLVILGEGNGSLPERPGIGLVQGLFSGR